MAPHQRLPIGEQSVPCLAHRIRAEHTDADVVAFGGPPRSLSGRAFEKSCGKPA